MPSFNTYQKQFLSKLLKTVTRKLTGPTSWSYNFFYFTALTRLRHVCLGQPSAVGTAGSHRATAQLLQARGHQGSHVSGVFHPATARQGHPVLPAEQLSQRLELMVWCGHSLCVGRRWRTPLTLYLSVTLDAIPVTCHCPVGQNGCVPSYDHCEI